jgi:hypothetical protein
MRIWPHATRPSSYRPTRAGRATIAGLLLVLIFQMFASLAMPCLSGSATGQCCDPLNARTGSSSCGDCVELGAEDALQASDAPASATPAPDVLHVRELASYTGFALAVTLPAPCRGTPQPAAGRHPAVPLRC